jgi:DNA-binding winged helix-turn-helix (wHTH) protein/tetratricopeptide (TPR) repeat protein
MASLRYTSQHIVLEPQSWRIQVSGEVLTPEPKVFELLVYLMRNPGRVVSKAELLDSLWGGEVVGESVLTRCVSCLRKLLADDAREPRFIRTAHGRGYEFISAVTEQVVAAVANQNAIADPSSVDPSQAEARIDAVFVGREREVARLRAQLRDVDSVRARLVLVTGEAGIGKTRLLEEVSRAPPPGLEVHWARASNVEGAPPFFLWRQCLRSVVRQRSLKAVSRSFRAPAAGARKLLLGADQWQADEQVGWDSPTHRFRMFDAIAQAIAELSRQRTLVFVLDDLHAADLSSLLLLEFLLEQLATPLLVLAAIRDAEPLASSDAQRLLSGIRARSREEVALLGLEHDEARGLVGSLRKEPTPQSVEQLHRRTGGNPLFLSLLAQSLEQERLPEALRQAVANRLSRLAPGCLGLLRLAAVFGREFQASLLARAAGLKLWQCLPQLGVAVEARLIASHSSDEFHFVHDLVREVLYDQLDGEERGRLHLAVGRVLEALTEYQLAEQAARLVHHFVQAAHYGGASRALDLSIQAGAYALRNFAYEDAIQHFTRAARLLPVCADADAATECAILLDLGLSQVGAGLRDAGQASLRLAAAKAREQGLAEVLAQVALGLAPGLLAIETGVYDPALVELLREALQQLGDLNDRLRALLLARLSLALYWSDTFEERVALCREAEGLAKKLDSDEVSAFVLTARAFSLLRPSNLQERRLLSERALQSCRGASDNQSLLLNRLLLGAVLLEEGDLAAATFEADAFRQLAEATRQPQALWIVEAHRASRLLLDGQLDAVEAVAQGCLLTGQRTRDHNALLTFGVHFCLVRIEQGRSEEILPLIRDYAAKYPLIVGWRVLHAYALSRAGRLQACTAEYESLRARAFELPDDLNWLVSMAWLAETCHTLGDADVARLLYARLTPFAERLVVVGYAGIACLGSVQRFLGLLSATDGRLDHARGHLEAAVQANRGASASLPLAYTLRDLSSVLLASEGHSQRARECIEEAESFVSGRKLPVLAMALAAVRERLQAPAPQS